VSREKVLGELAAALGTEVSPSYRSDTTIRGVTEDTRRLAPGDLFVAIPGTYKDGAAYAEEAVGLGASAVACERDLELGIPTLRVPDARQALARLSAAFYDHPTKDLVCIGVTGTNGKTTICHWIAHLLGEESCALVGTVANEARGLHGLTTPPSSLLHRMARDALDAGKTTFIIEASSIGLAQERLHLVALDIAAFSNLTLDHLDWHADRDAYAEAKSKLFRLLDPTGWGVLNADDSAAEQMAAAAPGHVLRVGLLDAYDLSATDVQIDRSDTRFRLVSGAESLPAQIPVAGVHNVENALVAAGVALCSGLRLERVVRRLATVPTIPGRWETYRRDRDGLIAVVDFAHNDAGLRRMLTELRPTARRLLVVFGCPGGTDVEKRYRMGEAAGSLADLTIVTSDNPKDEDPEAIGTDISAGIRAEGGNHHLCPDRTKAIGMAVSLADAGDVILVAGKGHETFQIVRGEPVPHEDRKVLRDLGFVPREGRG